MSEKMRSVVVTGCARGIGEAIFRRLVDDHWCVVGVDSDPAATDLDGVDSNARVVIGDVAEAETWARAQAAATELAPLRGWVNNAGVAIGGNLHEPNADDVNRLLDINLGGVFWGCSAAVRTFVEQRSSGAIVNVSSIHGRAAFPGWAAYDMAKGGVDALTRYVAVEYGPVGIRANAIAPGAIRTPMVQQVIDDAPDGPRAEWEMSGLHPLARLGEPEEVAAVASFLLSDDSSFISGESIAVDGAATARCFRFEPDAELLSRYGL